MPLPALAVPAAKFLATSAASGAISGQVSNMIKGNPEGAEAQKEPSAKTPSPAEGLPSQAEF